MTVLVTGAAGFIGSHLVDRLLDRGERVLALDLFDDFYDPRVKEANLRAAATHEGFTQVRGDVRDPDLLDSLPDGIDAVVHLAARAGVRPSIDDPALYTSVNVQGTVTLLEFVRTRAIARLVFASSSSVYGERSKVPFREDDPVDAPISPYAASKRAGELLCGTYAHLHGITCVALRYFTVFGPRQRPDLAIHKFARLLREGRPVPMYGDGSTERDYTYVADSVAGTLAALDWTAETPAGSYEIVNLGAGRTISLREMIDTLASALGVPPEIEALPAQPGDVSRTCAEIGKARRLLGYDPATSFVEGVSRFVHWLEDAGGGGAPDRSEEPS